VLFFKEIKTFLSFFLIFAVRKSSTLKTGTDQHEFGSFLYAKISFVGTQNSKTLNVECKSECGVDNLQATFTFCGSKFSGFSVYEIVRKTE
jgi:hypothetical protein